MLTVAVESGLEPVKNYLESQGCQCVTVQNGDAVVNEASCIVVTGMDQNLMGMEDTLTKIPVISADGLTPEQVYQRVRTYLH